MQFIEDQTLEKELPELSVSLNFLYELMAVLEGALIHFVIVGIFLYNASRFPYFYLKFLNVKRLVPSFRQ